MVAILMTVSAFLGQSASALALDHFKLLDVVVGKERFEGRVLVHDEQACWLLQRDGRLQQFATSSVSEFAERNGRFRASSVVEIKRQLEAEFGSEFEVCTSNHYVVVARPGSAKAYVSMFERIYIDFVRTFRDRGLKVVETEFPLIAIVFSDQSALQNYCLAEKTRLPSSAIGYYLSSSNRVAMYERPTATEIDITVIHEAVHQVAFNTGVHSRLAKDPVWVVEGLATVFESDGIRNRQGAKSLAERVNRHRYLWFEEYSRTRRSANSLRNFIREDSIFETETLDAYSEAWALSFYLLETRSTEYSRYLKRLAARDPLKEYTADDRERDFTQAFGPNLDRMESAFLLFMKRLQAARGDSGGR